MKKIIIIGLIIIVAIGGYFLIKKNKNTGNGKNSDSNTQIQANTEMGTLPSTGSFITMKIDVKGYNLEINSKKAGHPSKDVLFATSFNMKDSNMESSYDVYYKELHLKSDKDEKGNIIEDISKPEMININGKKFEVYGIGTLDEKDTVNLYYLLPDQNGSLEIIVQGKNSFDSDGKILNKRPIVDKKVIESDELAGILNFSINK